jgi:hypothetical protein
VDREVEEKGSSRNRQPLSGSKRKTRAREEEDEAEGWSWIRA